MAGGGVWEDVLILTTLPLWLPIVGAVFLGRQVQKAGAALTTRKPSGQVRLRAQTLSTAQKKEATASAPAAASSTDRRADAAKKAEAAIALPGHIKAGWLTKLGEKHETWRRRYFVVTPDVSWRNETLTVVLAIRSDIICSTFFVEMGHDSRSALVPG